MESLSPSPATTPTELPPVEQAAAEQPMQSVLAALGFNTSTIDNHATRIGENASKIDACATKIDAHAETLTTHREQIDETAARMDKRPATPGAPAEVAPELVTTGEEATPMQIGEWM